MKKFLTTIFLYALLLPLVAQTTDNVKLANEYFNRREYEKARTLYEDLARDFSKIPLIHNNYFFLLTTTGEYKEAEKYLDRIIKRFPGQVEFRIDLGRVYIAEGKEGTADSYFNNLIDEIKTNSFLVRQAANYFNSNLLPKYAERTFLESRKSVNNTAIYSLELANFYRVNGEPGKMVNEYLTYLDSNPGNARYVKNILQSLMQDNSELESLEAVLYNKIQEKPDNLVYPDLLIWAQLQLKNFYGAFVQARALDIRTGQEGIRTLEIGMIALNNQDFNSAARAFNWIIETYPSKPVYIQAKIHLIEAYEMRVKNTFPISKEEVRKVIEDYDLFLKEVGIDRSTLQAMRNKAILHAFYLDELDTAISILSQIIEIPRVNKEIQAQSKLDLGDIYLLSGQPWESTLLYSQVEKDLKESPIAYEAKLKNAKLSYYRGDFLLAQEHLDIIKKATTREIANDAMALSILIKENIALDSTEAAMKAYAHIDLLLYQNKTEEGLQEIEQFKKSFQSHSLEDDILYLQSGIYLKEAKFNESITLLEKIIESHGFDVLGDDAMFTLAEIYELHLNQPDKAQEIYLEFLTKYPGSVYVAEARKRYRRIRGDFQEEPLN